MKNKIVKTLALIITLLLMHLNVSAQLCLNTNDTYLFEIGESQVALTSRQKNKYLDFHVQEKIKTLIIFNKIEFNKIVNSSLLPSNDADTNKCIINEALMMMDISFKDKMTIFKCGSIILKFKKSKSLIITNENNKTLNMINNLLKDMSLDVYNKENDSSIGINVSWVFKLTPPAPSSMSK